MGTIPVQELSWRITLDMVLLKPTEIKYQNVYHFTTNGQSNGAQQGNRSPGLWINYQRLHFVFNIDDNGNVAYQPVGNIALNQKLRAVIEQVMVSNRPVVRILVNNKITYEMSHNWQIPFKNVKFYMSSPFYEAAPVKILYFSYEELETL